MDDSDGIALSLYDLVSVNDCAFAMTPQNFPVLPGFPGTGGYWRSLAAGTTN